MTYRRGCLLCGSKELPLFQIPSNYESRLKWFYFLENCCGADLTKINDYTVLCDKHFDSECIALKGNKRRLNKDAVPTIFQGVSIGTNKLVVETETIQKKMDRPKTHTHVKISSFAKDNFVSIIDKFQDTPLIVVDDEPVKTVEQKVHEKAIQVGSMSLQKFENLKRQRKLADNRTKRLLQKYSECTAEASRLRGELYKHSKEIRLIGQIKRDAENSGKAKFLLDLIQNYSQRKARWSRRSLDLCRKWRMQSPKGYEYCKQNLINLPSRSTIARDTIKSYMDSCASDNIVIDGTSPVKEEVIETEICQDEIDHNYEMNVEFVEDGNGIN